MALLEIKNLTVKAKDKLILNGLSLSIPNGGIHVIMGPNGSGKSTLCSILMDHPDYEVTGGSISFEGADLSLLKTDERARKGIFLSFQHPREIPGVSLAQITRSAINSNLKEKGIKNSGTSKDFIKNLKERLNHLGLAEDFLRRPLNEHASGGEKKRLEMVQLAMLKPKLAILDEIDSGLDIDAMKLIAENIKEAVREYNTTFLIITHYQRLLQHITPDSVHVIVDGKIVKSGDSALAHELERDGYKSFTP
jgi:Fe-S cluster assembly ATP-binding protein